MFMVRNMDVTALATRHRLSVLNIRLCNGWWDKSTHYSIIIRFSYSNTYSQYNLHKGIFLNHLTHVLCDLNQRKTLSNPTQIYFTLLYILIEECGVSYSYREWKQSLYWWHLGINASGRVESRFKITSISVRNLEVKHLFHHNVSKGQQIRSTVMVLFSMSVDKIMSLFLVLWTFIQNRLWHKNDSHLLRVIRFTSVKLFIICVPFTNEKDATKTQFSVKESE